MAQTPEYGGGREKKQKIRHIPYHVTRTLDAGEERKEQIAEDDIKGLRTAGRAGYIYNTGAGSIEIKMYDGDEWSGWITIAAGAGINIFYEDNIWMHTIRVKANRLLGASYELTVNPGLSGEG